MTDIPEDRFLRSLSGDNIGMLLAVVLGLDIIDFDDTRLVGIQYLTFYF